MKKYIIAIVLTFGVMFGLHAQNDGFFSYSTNSGYREDKLDFSAPATPLYHGALNDHDAEEAPVGSGILLLAGLGLGYAALSKRKQ